MNRREFLRLGVLTLAGAAVSACQTPVSPEPSLSAILPTAGIPIQLLGSDADAWVWNKAISGKLQAGLVCEAVSVRANNQEYPAVLSGEGFSAEVTLKAGVNTLQGVCSLADGEEESSNMLNYTQRMRRAPKAVINLRLVGNQVVLDGTSSQPAQVDGTAIERYQWTVRESNPSPLQVVEPGGQSLTVGVDSPAVTLDSPKSDGEYYINLKVMDQEGLDDASVTYFVIENGQARLPDFATEHPAWVDTAVVYGVIPRLFGAPAFQRISEHLDDLAELGVNALWLAPVNVSPKGDYGYAIVDYFELNPEYGTKDDFHQMVQAAHGLGIRVLMDFVPNHSSAQHPYFLDAREKGKGSPYWDFYDRDEAGEPTHYFSWEHLPNLNYKNPEVKNWIQEAFSYWVREFDVDGFRVDVAWGIRERQPDFWPTWRSELKRIKPDLLLLAEASARDEYYFDQGFDAAYDWTDQLGHWAWELVWDSYKNRLLAYNLEAVLTNRPVGYHPEALVFRFLNNNDTGDRFITRQGEPMARVSTALLLTLPGIPCIYTGDEMGAEYQPYAGPPPLDWQERYPGIWDYHHKLIALRKELPALHFLLWEPLKVKPLPQEVFVYLRYTPVEGDAVAVILNFSEEPALVKFELPERFKQMTSSGTWLDRLNDETIPVEQRGEVSVSLPVLGARILVKRA